MCYIGCFIAKTHFKDNGMHNYLEFQLVYKYSQTPTNSDMVIASKSKGLSEKSIKSPVISDNSLNSGINYIDNAKIRVKSDGPYQSLK